MDEFAKYIIMQSLGNHRVGDAAFDILIDSQVETRQQLDLANQDQVMVLGKILQQEPQLAKGFHLHQMSVVDDGDQHLAAPIETERFLDQFAFALERRTLELDPKRFAQNFDRVGISVQRSGHGSDYILLVRELLE